MIKHWLFTGDCHSDFSKFYNLKNINPIYTTDETAIVILGDAGVNYWGDKRDYKAKQRLRKYGDYIIYCVRGNHDRSPKSLGYHMAWDYDVNGWVYIDPDFPNIKYFAEFGYYNIQHYTICVIGGAFSVDKYYRLSKGMNWFKDEQIPEDELITIIEDVKDKPIDIMLTHTCPDSWQPTDLFLPQVNQKLVDKTTEKWLDVLAREGHWENWLWGHFHADRNYPDGRRHMLMDNFKTLEEIVAE